MHHLTRRLCISLLSVTSASTVCGCSTHESNAGTRTKSHETAAGRGESHDAGDSMPQARAEAGAGASMPQARAEAGTGASMPQAGAEAGAPAPSADEPESERTYRISELYLRDPHLRVDTNDITDTPYLGSSVNGSFIKNALSMDFDKDGFIDNSMLLQLRLGGARAELHMIRANCRPTDAAHCAARANPEIDATFAIERRDQGTCLQPLAATTSGYDPGPSSPTAPCFVSTDTREVAIDLGGIKLALRDVRVAAGLEGDPAKRLVSGLIAGFLTDDSAKQAMIPSYVPLLAGTPLAKYLAEADRDGVAASDQKSGFWVYLNFVAESAEYQPR
jgi:hypothetical protein